MNRDAVEHLRKKTCNGKQRLGMGAARRIARDMDGMGAYRCVFCDPFPDSHQPVWHVGHGPTMETLTLMAAYQRERSQLRK